MFRYLVRRLLWAVLLFLVVTFVTFVIFFMAPVATQRLVCGGAQARPECMQHATKSSALDQPVPTSTASS